MRRALLAALLLVASPAFAQANGWQEMANGWGEIQTPTFSYATAPPPASATLGCVGVFLGSPLTLQCAPSSGIVYTTATKSLDVTDGRVQAANLKAIGLATPGGITVTPTLTQVGSITTVAGSALADGDYFTIKYDGGTVPIEFDLSPGDGTTGGRIPLLFTAGDSADTVRDNVILALNAAAPTKLTASSGGAATVALVLDTPGADASATPNTENVADAGFAVTGFADPTHATTVTYQLVACLADGSCTQAGVDSTTGTATATLSAANFNRLSWSAVSGAASYKIRRDVGGATQGVIWSGTALTVDDTGLAGDGTAKPTVNGTGLLSGTFAGSIVRQRPADNSEMTIWSSPAADGRTHEAPFGIHVGGATFESEWDPVMYFGYNPLKTVAGEPTFTWTIEGNYKHGRRDIEVYWEYVTANGVGWRPISLWKNKADTALVGEQIDFVAEQITQGGTRAAPVQYLFSPINADQPATVAVSGAGTGGGDKQFLRLIGGYDPTYGAAIQAFGNLCTNVAGAKGALLLDGGNPATPTAGSMQGAVVVRTGATPTERLRVEPDGNVVIGNPGVAGAALLDVNGSFRATGLPSLTGLSVYADNTAALAGGLVAGDVYRTSTGVLMVTY